VVSLPPTKRCWRRFPAITSLEFKLVSNHARNAMTDEGMRAVSSLLL
jgi:hypothetical protein